MVQLAGRRDSPVLKRPPKDEWQRREEQKLWWGGNMTTRRRKCGPTNGNTRTLRTRRCRRQDHLHPDRLRLPCPLGAIEPFTTLRPYHCPWGDSPFLKTFTLTLLLPKKAASKPFCSAFLQPASFILRGKVPKHRLNPNIPTGS